MATIKDRLKMFEANGPPIKPKPNIKLDQLSKPLSTDREIKSKNIDNIDSNSNDRSKDFELSKPETENKDLTKTAYDTTKTTTTDKINQKSNSFTKENQSKHILNFKPKNEPIENLNSNSEPNSSDRDSLEEFTYEFDGSIYNLPGLENYILKDEHYYQEMIEPENSDPVVIDVEDNQSSRPIESSDNTKDESNNEIKRTASKKRIEEIFNTSVWRNSKNFDDDYIFNPVAATSQTGIESSGSEKYVDGQSTMSSSPSTDERRKSTTSLNQKSNKRNLFSGIFRSKRGPKKSNEKCNNTSEQGYDVYDSDGIHGSPDKTSLNKMTDGDTDSVEHVTKKPLNSIFNRDWLNSLGEGIKKKANVMAELRKVFSHGKPKVSKKKAQKSDTGDPVEKKYPKEEVVDDIYDDGGEDVMSSEEEVINAKKAKIKYQIKYPIKPKNNDIKPKEEIEEDIYDEDDNNINNETISDSNSIYDDGEEIDVPPCKPVQEKQEISLRKSPKSRNQNKVKSLTKNSLRQSKIEDSIYDSAGDDEETEMPLEPTVSEKDKKGNDSSKSKPSSDNCSASKKTGSEVTVNAVDSDVYTDCEEVDESLMVDENSTKKDNCSKNVSKKSTKTVSNNSSNNIGISDLKKHFFNKTKSKQKASSNGKENSKQKEKKPEKTKDQKSKLNLKLFRKRSLRDDVYDVDYVDDEEMLGYSDNVEERVPESSSSVSKIKDKSINDDMTYDSDDIEIEEYASDPEDVDIEEPPASNLTFKKSTTTDKLLSKTKFSATEENNTNEKKSKESTKSSELMKKKDDKLQKNTDTFIEEYQDDNNNEKNVKKTNIKKVSNLKDAVKANNKVNDLNTQNDAEIYDEDYAAESISDAEEVNPPEVKPKSIKNFNNAKQTNFPIFANKNPKDKSVYHIGKISSDIMGKQNNIISGLKFTYPNLKAPINKCNPSKTSKEVLDTEIYDDDEVPSGINESQQEKSVPIEELQMNETDDPVIKKLIKKNLESARKTFKLKNPIVPISLAKALKTVYSTAKNHIQLNIGELVEVILLKDGYALVKNGVGKCGWTSPTNLQTIKTYEAS